MTMKLIKEYREWGLKINIKKTEYLALGSNEVETLKSNESKSINQCFQYTYFGVTINKIKIYNSILN